MNLTVDGTRISADSAGHDIDPARPAVVFIHGAANDHSVWALQSRYFAYHGWNMLAVDLPGHGRSGGTALSDIGALADWTRALLDAAGIAKAALVGHSMGSLVALETAARFPERISRIALIGTAVPMPVSEPLLAASKADDHVAYDLINAFAHSPGGHLGGNRVPGVWTTGNNMRLMERSGPGVLFADFSACNSYLAGLDAAQQVRCPALLVLGRRDQMTPLHASKDVTARLATATTGTVDGAGHALMAERPDAVLDALIQFMHKDRK